MCGIARVRSKDNIKETMAGVQEKDDGLHYGDDLGNGENDLIFV